MEETKRAREDLVPLIETMLAGVNRTYHGICENFLDEAKNRTETEEFIRYELMFRVCWNQRVMDAPRVMHPCMLSEEKYHAHKPDVLNVMSTFFKISRCLIDETVEKFDSVCGGNEVAEYCEDTVAEMPASLLCHAYGIWIGSVPLSEERFRAGVALKEAYGFQQQVSSKASNLLNHLINQNEEDNYSLECLMAALSSYGMVNKSQECEKENIGMDFWLGHMDLVYKLQKQLIPPTSRIPSEKREVVDVDIVKKAMQSEYLYQMENEEIINDYSTVLTCKFGDLDSSQSCKLFSNTFTTGGIGYTFNNEPYWNLFKNTTSNYAFYKEIYETENSFESELPRYIVNTGQGFSLDFIVRHDTYGYRYENDQVLGNYQEVFLALHDPSKLPNLRAEGVVIQPGLFYDIRVIPSITITDESGLALDAKARNCLSKDDNEDLLTFNAYSQSACILECKLQKAISQCHCSAWDYPRIDESVHLCVNNTENNDCFLKVMNNDAVANECDCLNDCEHITYDVDLHVTTLRELKGATDSSGVYDM